MKRILNIILLLLSTWATAQAQDHSAFRIITDREIYVSGETILAQLWLPSGEPAKIVYVDLATLSGTHISGVATETINHQAAVHLELPDSLETASYVVRLFVNEMDTKNFAAQQILVANRFDKLDALNEIPVIAAESLHSGKANGIRINRLNPAYPVRTTVTAKVQIEEQLLNELKGNLLFSISEVLPQVDLPEFSITAQNGETGICEDKGMVISGKVINKVAATPAAGKLVYLTIPDSIPYFQYAQTGSDGQFSFLIRNHYGKTPLVIQCPESDNKQPSKIILNKKFDLYSKPIETKPIDIPVELSSYIDKLAEIRFMKILFEQAELHTKSPTFDSLASIPYYGLPSRMVYPDEFYDLSDFSEISRELLPGVKFRQTKNGPALRVLNNPFHDYFNEQPLLLVDGIPVSDIGIINNMGTSEIDRVDFTLSERFYGDLRFPGVVALYTKDSAQRPFSQSDQLVLTDIDAIQPAFELLPAAIGPDHLPDVRQTLLWQPNLQPASSMPLNFRTSDVKGNYRILISGTKADGEQFRFEQFFEVN